MITEFDTQRKYFMRKLILKEANYFPKVPDPTLESCLLWIFYCSSLNDKIKCLLQTMIIK